MPEVMAATQGQCGNAANAENSRLESWEEPEFLMIFFQVTELTTLELLDFQLCKKYTFLFLSQL